MKKTLSLFLVLAMLLSLGACATETNPHVSSDLPTDSTPVMEMQASAEDVPQLAVEDFEVVRYDNDTLSFKVKLRNISDVDKESISFLYQLLDANGDILDDQLCGAASVDAGQAIWAGQYSISNDIHIEDVAAVAITSNPYTGRKNSIAEKMTFQVPSGQPIGGDAQMPDNTEAFTQFRDYLEKRGTISIVTEEINGSNITGHHQVSIEATTEGIQVSYEDEVTTVAGKSSAFGKSLLRFTLSPNVKRVNSQVEYFLGGDDGNGHKDIRSAATTYSWDIHNYRNGNELSLTTDYTQVDENGNSIKQEGTQLTLVMTNPCADATMVLSQVLQESGLDVTMDDLGFANY